MNIKDEPLYLEPEEAKFISMAVVSMIGEFQGIYDNPEINWDAEVRKDLKNMLAVGNTLKEKLQKIGFDMRDDFLTKPS